MNPYLRVIGRDLAKAGKGLLGCLAFVGAVGAIIAIIFFLALLAEPDGYWSELPFPVKVLTIWGGINTTLILAFAIIFWVGNIQDRVKKEKRHEPR